MRLDRWLADSGLNVAAFARQLGVSRRGLYKVLDGHWMSLETAARIVRATGGIVGYEDLVASVTCAPLRPHGPVDRVHRRGAARVELIALAKRARAKLAGGAVNPIRIEVVTPVTRSERTLHPP